MEKPSPSHVPRTPFYSFARVLLSIFTFLFYPTKAHGLENLNREAPFILVANHQSLMDPILVALHVKPWEIRFLGKDTLRKNAILRWLVDHLHMISVARGGTDMAAMRACLKALSQGHVVGIFPEGTRKEARMMEEVRSGVGLIALRSQAPLVPVLIAQKPRLFRRTHVYFGQAIDYQDIQAMGTNKQSCELLADRIRDTTYAMKDKVEQGEGLM